MKKFFLSIILGAVACCLQAQDFTHYLLAYFTGNAVEEEQIKYAVSDNGTNFEALAGGNPLIKSSEISLSGGVRDPFIVRGTNDGYFYMCITDMKSSLGWSSNRGLIIMRSKDLINWQSKAIHFPTRFPEQWGDVTRVWAPEIIWDEEEGKYLIYYSLLSQTLPYDKLFYSYISFEGEPENWDIDEPKDFYCYSQNGQEKATIDANIIRADGKYYMFFKTEDSEKRVRLMYSEKLKDWYNASTPVVAADPGEAEEGPCCFQLIGQNKWIFMSDLFGRWQATFRQRTTTDFKTFTEIGDLSGVAPRHGSVIWLTEEETQRLAVWGELRELMDANADLKDAEAYKNAVEAIKTGDKEKMKAALETLQTYLESDELKQSLRNGNFDAGLNYWLYDYNYSRPVAGGASANPCMEVWNAKFNCYQELSGLPNGTYRLQAQAFYRTAKNATAWSQRNTASVSTYIYLNENAVAVKNIMLEDREDAYTWGNSYNTPDGTYVPNDMSTASEAFEAGMYENEVIAYVDGGTIRVGIKNTTGTANDRWSIWDNFRLTRISEDDITGIRDIETIKSSYDTLEEYDLSGRQASSVKGVKIIVKDGKARKVIR